MLKKKKIQIKITQNYFHDNYGCKKDSDFMHNVLLMNFVILKKPCKVLRRRTLKCTRKCLSEHDIHYLTKSYPDYVETVLFNCDS